MYWIEYFLYMLPAYLLVLIIQIVLKSTVSKYSNVKTNMCGAAAAELVLRKAGVAGVNIGLIKGDLTDNYDPSSSVIHLSDRVYSVSSVTAVAA